MLPRFEMFSVASRRVLELRPNCGAATAQRASMRRPSVLPRSEATPCSVTT